MNIKIIYTVLLAALIMILPVEFNMCAENMITPSPAATSQLISPTAKPGISAKKGVLSQNERNKVSGFRSMRVDGVRFTSDSVKKTKLEWEMLSFSEGYNVYRSDKKNGRYKLIAKVKKNSCKDRKTKARNKYFYRIKGRLKLHGKEYLSDSSKVISVYVQPEKPRTVIAGECFVGDFVMIRKTFPKNIKFVYKIGVNTYTMQHNNYFTYNGNTITGIERVATYRPDRVYFLIGANESAWTSPKWTMSNYNKMYKLLKKVNRNVQVVLIAIPPFGMTSTQHIPSVSKRASYNNAYRKYAEKHKNVFYCDATKVLSDQTSHLIKKYDGGDGCHWNTTGAIAVAAELKKWSKAQFKNW